MNDIEIIVQDDRVMSAVLTSGSGMGMSRERVTRHLDGTFSGSFSSSKGPRGSDHKDFEEVMLALNPHAEIQDPWRRLFAIKRGVYHDDVRDCGFWENDESPLEVELDVKAPTSKIYVSGGRVTQIEEWTSGNGGFWMTFDMLREGDQFIIRSSTQEGGGPSYQGPLEEVLPAYNKHPSVTDKYLVAFQLEGIEAAQDLWDIEDLVKYRVIFV